MSLSNDYQRQISWRSWPDIFAVLLAVRGQIVVDLGCGVGHQSAEFVVRGRAVIGVDANEELLRTARSKRLANAEFLSGNLRALPDLGIAADGLWCSFTAAYFPDLAALLATWATRLKPRGWIALVEIDNLFGHEPLSEKAKSLFEAYACDAFVSGRYDFQMGHKLRGHLERAGFHVTSEFTVEDQEQSFVGAACEEVVDAWRSRFDRMQLLRDFCGEDFRPL